jgi:hypothetical protein
MINTVDYIVDNLLGKELSMVERSYIIHQITKRQIKNNRNQKITKYFQVINNKSLCLIFIDILEREAIEFFSRKT